MPRNITFGKTLGSAAQELRITDKRGEGRRAGGEAADTVEMVGQQCPPGQSPESLWGAGDPAA
jgi:hypothetical protein